MPARSALSSKARWTARRCFATSRRGSARIDIFSQLRIWDTAHNNGVLIYLLLADRQVEIVADRGIDAKVGSAGWEKICRAMEAEFKAGHFERGVIEGNRGGLAATGEIFPRPRSRAQRIAGCAGGDLEVDATDHCHSGMRRLAQARNP